MPEIDVPTPSVELDLATASPDALRAEIGRLRTQLAETTELRERYLAMRKRAAALLRDFAAGYYFGMEKTPAARVVVRPESTEGAERSVPMRAFVEAALAVNGAPADSFWRTPRAIDIGYEEDQRFLAEVERLSAPRAPAPGPLLCWCDGSGQSDGESAGPAAAGVVLVDGPARVERGFFLGRGTNNHAELWGVKHTLQEIRALDAQRREIVIHTDSEYAIGILTKRWTAKANAELVAAIKDELRYFPLLTFRHVKGHAGDVHNEMADRLAAAAVAIEGPVDSMQRATEILTPPSKTAKLGPKAQPPQDAPGEWWGARIVEALRDISSVCEVRYGQRADGSYLVAVRSYAADPGTHVQVERALHTIAQWWPRRGVVAWDWVHAYAYDERAPWRTLWKREAP